MLKSALLTIVTVALSASVVSAQDARLPAKDLPENGGAGARTGNITATGATVPNPGASQGAGTTSLDRGIQADDTKIQGSICKGC